MTHFEIECFQRIAVDFMMTSDVLHFLTPNDHLASTSTWLYEFHLFNFLNRHSYIVATFFHFSNLSLYGHSFLLSLPISITHSQHFSSITLSLHPMSLFMILTLISLLILNFFLKVCDSWYHPNDLRCVFKRHQRSVLQIIP